MENTFSKLSVRLLSVIIILWRVCQGIADMSTYISHNLTSDNISIVLNGSSDNCKGGALIRAHVSCVCIIGLWGLYDSKCSSPIAIVASTSKKCFKIDSQIEKVILFSSDTADMRMTYSALPVDNELANIGPKLRRTLDSPASIAYVGPGRPQIITTGLHPWRIPDKQLCLQPAIPRTNVIHFCMFNHSMIKEYRLINQRCLLEDEILSPTECYPFLHDEYNDSSCHLGPPYQYVKNRGGRNKRDTDHAEHGDNDTSIIVDENDGLLNKVEFSFMNTEIWNFITYRAEVRLGIRQSDEPNKHKFYTPAFTFLDIAKKIQQKACPEHYVRDEHYDIAIGAFENLQRNIFGFEEPHLDLDTAGRITDALTRCFHDVEEYPFLQRTGQRNPSCNVDTKITHGMYEMDDKVMDLTLSHEQGSRKNEPIAETVWKVFVHAHSACFPFFNDSYNDHHRFATVIIPLFTNHANDLWFSVSELRADVYNGFLGDAVDLMDSVAYCAMYARLDSEYPWDLPRPRKNNARKRRSHEFAENHSNSRCLSEIETTFNHNCQENDPYSAHGDVDLKDAAMPQESINAI